MRVLAVIPMAWQGAALLEQMAGRSLFEFETIHLLLVKLENSAFLGFGLDLLFQLPS